MDGNQTTNINQSEFFNMAIIAIAITKSTVA